jgi:hypothetical protein
MTTATYNKYKTAAMLGLIPDEENPLFLFSQTDKELLLDITNGKIDPIELAKMEMRNRGLDTKTGKWIGWKNETIIKNCIPAH